jgi:hypothetical protein
LRIRGLPDPLLGVAWRSMRLSFELHARYGIGASIGLMIMTSVLKGNGEVDENPARCCEQDDESYWKKRREEGGG